MNLREVIGTLYRLKFADGKSYVGACLCTASRRYHRHKRLAIDGDTAPVHEAWRRLGAPALVILATDISEDALWGAERNAIKNHTTRIPHGYNATSGSSRPPGHFGKKGAMTGRKHTAAARLKMSQSSIGKPGTNLGKKFSQEHRERIRQAMIGKRHTIEALAKMSAAHRGSVHSQETKEKIRLGNIGRISPMKGRKHSESTKAKMRDAQSRRIRTPNGQYTS